MKKNSALFLFILSFNIGAMDNTNIQLKKNYSNQINELRKTLEQYNAFKNGHGKNLSTEKQQELQKITTHLQQELNNIQNELSKLQ